MVEPLASSCFGMGVFLFGEARVAGEGISRQSNAWCWSAPTQAKVESLAVILPDRWVAVPNGSDMFSVVFFPTLSSDCMNVCGS